MYLFYLNDVQLPVTPSKLQLKIKNQNKTMNLINDGEINILKSPGLTEISFTALLPITEYPFAQYSNVLMSGRLIQAVRAANLKPGTVTSVSLSSGRGNVTKRPSYYLNILEKLKTECKSFPFTVIRTVNGREIEEDTKFIVSLEEYTVTEDAENGSDFSVDIKLRQYTEFGTKIITISDGEATATEERDSSSAEETVSAGGTYTVQSGDTLTMIAKTHLGDSSRWTEIYELNKDVIEAAAKANGRDSSSNGWWIYPGTVLTLPS